MFFCNARQFAPKRPPFFYEMIKAAHATRKLLYKMDNQTQLSTLKIGTFRQIVALIFPSDGKAARAAQTFFSIYYSFWKGAADAGPF